MHPQSHQAHPRIAFPVGNPQAPEQYVVVHLPARPYEARKADQNR